MTEAKTEANTEPSNHNITPMLIGIAGKKRVGKDTVAKMLKTALYQRSTKAVIVSFAQPIRDISHTFGFTANQIFTDKDEINPIWGISWRTFAQQIGTDVFRNTWRSDVWIRILEMRLHAFTKHSDNDFIIISDVRMDSEVEFIKECKGFVINIIRDTDKMEKNIDTHITEQGVSTWNISIMNMDTLDVLQKKCEQLADSLINMKGTNNV